MEFADWEPVYDQILRAFGYGRDGDEQARDRLSALLDDAEIFDPTSLNWGTGTVAIAGGAHSLTERAELDTARNAETVVAASVAADRLREHGIAVDCMVTDLDKNPETVQELTETATPVAVHAHGDNIAALNEWLPRLDTEYVIPTTQAKPLDSVWNFGGFTDGDRAAFFADALGAPRLVFPGWEFDDQTVSAEKRQKLQWAERLLHWLEGRRNRQFAVLDGRRDGIDELEL